MIHELTRTTFGEEHLVMLGCSSCNWKATITNVVPTHSAYVDEIIRLVSLEHDCWGTNGLGEDAA